MIPYRDTRSWMARERFAFARWVTHYWRQACFLAMVSCYAMSRGWMASQARWSMAGSISAHRSTCRGNCTVAGRAANSSSSTKAVTLVWSGAHGMSQALRAATDRDAAESPNP
jgi:hypothetical protein